MSITKTPRDLVSQNIQNALPEKYKHIKIDILDTVDSTNTRLKAMAECGAPHMSVLIAHTQTGGRGRQGRSFFSPIDTGLYMSVLFRPKGCANDAQLMTIRAAVAVCRAIEKNSESRPKIKWVNDIYLNKKKVCGILTEASISPDGRKIDYLIVGIGINCTTKDCDFPSDIRDSSTSLNLTSPRYLLAADVLTELFDLFDLEKFCVIEEYKSRSMMIDKLISFTRDNKIYRAQVIDISDDGGLIVCHPDGDIETLSSGEVHILKDFLKE